MNPKSRIDNILENAERIKAKVEDKIAEKEAKIAELKAEIAELNADLNEVEGIIASVTAERGRHE